MKLSRNGHYYEVINKADTSGLCLHYYTNDNESFESVVNAIKRAEELAEERGYPQKTEWLIVCVEWKKTFMDGMFFEETKTRRAVATYFDGIVEDL